MVKHICTQTERILTLELNFKNYMDRMEEKLDTILEIVKDMPNVYAKKEEVIDLKNKFKLFESWETSVKIAMIKTRWPIISTIIMAAVTIATLLRK